MAQKISLSLTDQEKLLLEIRTLSETVRELEGKVEQLVEQIPNLTNEGEYEYRRSEFPVGNFLPKAKTYQTLTELLYAHTYKTYEKLIDADKLLAQDIYQQLLKDRSLTQELKDQIQKDPTAALKTIQEETVPQITSQAGGRADMLLLYSGSSTGKGETS